MLFLKLGIGSVSAREAPAMKDGRCTDHADTFTSLLADENPVWVAKRVGRFLSQDPSPLPDANLSWLADKVTLTVGYYGTLRNKALAEGSA
jgi:hypothetical protein